ncbi:MAG TPA: calcium-binding protein, partial [Actinomycetota bacterium]|nr:calcium-binding protein [Actinomycetota bacterium]
MRAHAVLVSCALLLPGGVAHAQDAPECFGEKPTIVGTDGEDRLVGTPGRDVIAGLDGKDRIEGRGGDDLICAGHARACWGCGDIVKAGSGDDRLGGGAGGQRLAGGPGDDLLRAGDGDDTLVGGLGNDRAFAGVGNDMLIEGPGNDLAAGGEDFGIDGAGGDQVTFRLGWHVNADLAEGRATGDLGNDRIPDIEHVTGSRGDDVLAG